MVVFILPPKVVINLKRPLPHYWTSPLINLKIHDDQKKPPENGTNHAAHNHFEFILLLLKIEDLLIFGEPSLKY